LARTFKSASLNPVALGSGIQGLRRLFAVVEDQLAAFGFARAASASPVGAVYKPLGHMLDTCSKARTWASIQWPSPQHASPIGARQHDAEARISVARLVVGQAYVPCELRFSWLVALTVTKMFSNWISWSVFTFINRHFICRLFTSNKALLFLTVKGTSNGEPDDGYPGSKVGCVGQNGPKMPKTDTPKTAKTNAAIFLVDCCKLLEDVI
jgi:hypothetical protein